jgi:hypothetical protein
VTTGVSRGALDLLVVMGARDRHLAGYCLRSARAYLPALGRVHIVTNDVPSARELVDAFDVGEIDVVADSALLSTRELSLDGWYRQQLVKLRAGDVLTGDCFGTLSADAILLRPIGIRDIIDERSGRPFLYVNRYRYRSNHLTYEQQRVEAVGRLLAVEPKVSWAHGDFISDLFYAERDVLHAAHERLAQIHGRPWTRVLPDGAITKERKHAFGEYALYAVTALDLCAAPPPVRVRWQTHVLQIHGREALARARFDADVLHLVDKTIPLEDVRDRARQWNVEIL